MESHRTAAGAGPGDDLRFADWLALREPADARARASGLLDFLPDLNRNPVLIRDMGCGTGSLGRWLAGRLPGAQHWILHDQDRYVLAEAGVRGPAADGGDVTFETREGDLRGLDLDGTSLLTASALLDILTADDVDEIAAACAAANCPALLTLTVAGRVALDPADPLDTVFAAAFNDHQRRAGRLGPDAAGAAVTAFEARGMSVRTAPSPWRLGPGEATLREVWLRGWVAAACEQDPSLAAEAAGYLARRVRDPDLLAVVHHTDLLAQATS